MATGPNIRVSDAEREAVAGQLREHYGDGRLTLDELNERLDQTFAAKTASELHAVTTDLPRDAAGWTPRTSAAGSQLPVVPQGAGSRDDGWHGPRERMSAFAAPLVAVIAIAGVWALVMFGGLLGGGGRPFGVVLALAIFALIRRMFGGGRRSGRGGGCGRRW
jgi:hypothetical protein